MPNTNFQAVEIISIPEDKEIQTFALPEIKEIATKEEQKVQDYIPLEYRTQLVSHRGFRDIKTQMTDVFGYNVYLFLIKYYIKINKH
jgi:hypothetical protein